MVDTLIENAEIILRIDQPGLPEAMGETSVILPCCTSETL
jgi:hypothetical protein